MLHPHDATEPIPDVRGEGAVLSPLPPPPPSTRRCGAKARSRSCRKIPTDLYR